jgi:hypothetical protein
MISHELYDCSKFLSSEDIILLNSTLYFNVFTVVYCSYGTVIIVKK